jgi:hypothetical protein
MTTDTSEQQFLVLVIRSLDEAEKRPGFDFVALKWFRDLLLPGRIPQVAQGAIGADALIREAVESQIILTYKVPNPKSPSFPVTAIRLNRQHRVVRDFLQESGRTEEFHPVAIRGEALSTTVLRDRR